MSAYRERDELLREVPLFAGMPDHLLHRLATSAEIVRLEAGELLFDRGEPGDCLYVVMSGRVQVRVDGSAIRALARGEVFGELALLGDASRTATLRALRDTELLSVGRDHFLQAAAAHPPVLRGLVEVVGSRLPGAVREAPRRRGVVGLIGSAPVTGAEVRGVAHDLAARVRELTSCALIDEPDDATAAGRLLDRAEAEHDLVLLVCGDPGSRWAGFCRRQADRVLEVPGDVASTSPQALSRLARRLAGRAVGVVLSGGGARGFAHLGVVAALEEHGVVIDRWGGTSMGALVAAAYASGGSTAEIRDALRRELVERRPFRDVGVPRHGIIRVQRGERMLRRVLGDRRIEDLERPFFCVSCDLHAATEVVHRSGLLVAAVGASMRIPGVAPPLPQDGRLLVDGGVLNNLPVDVMAADDEGPVVAVDVMRPFATSGPEQMPGLLETVGRSLVLGSWQKAARNRRLADLVVTPELGGVGMFDWGRMAELVAAGRSSAERALTRGGAPLV